MTRRKTLGGTAGDKAKKSTRSKKPPARSLATDEQEHDTLLEALENSLSIEELELEVALQQQSSLFYQVSKELADAVSRRDAAKQLLDEVEAETSLAIRVKAAEDGVKVTEGQISAMIDVTDDVVSHRKGVIRANRRVSQYSALKDAFVQRSYALKDLVSLYINNYYADAAPEQAHGDLRDAQANRVKSHNKRERRNRS